MDHSIGCIWHCTHDSDEYISCGCHEHRRSGWEEITYAVLYAGDKLNVVNTRQINRYDYRGTIAPNESLLVYGWQLIDHSISGRDALMLFAPVMQTTQEQSITQLACAMGHA